MPKSRHDLWSARKECYGDRDLTVAEFCRRRGVFVPSFYQWNKKLGKAVTAASPAFLPIDITNRSVTSPAATLALQGRVTVEPGEYLSVAAGRGIFVFTEPTEMQNTLNALSIHNNDTSGI
jgi:hypothetical protein